MTYQTKMQALYCSLSMLILSITGHANLYAQQYEEAASIEFGGFDIVPTVDLGINYDDNLTQTNAQKIDSWSRLVSPNVTFQTQFAANTFQLGYRLRNESFFSSQADNYTDHFLLADLALEFNVRHRLDTSIEFEDGHDQRGSNFSIGSGQNLSEPDQYKQFQFDAIYSYGAFNADGRLEAKFNLRELNYDINTPRYRARDRQMATLSGTFYYRVGATLDATFDLRRTDIDYRFALNALNPLDSVVHEYLVGLKWEATAKTSGFVKIGYEEKDFASSSREDFSGFDWAAGVTWQPTEYASIDFVTSADTDETNGEGNFIRGRTHSVDWRHEWLRRLRSSVRIGWNDNRYEGQLIDGFDIRSDDNFSFRMAGYYQFRRWLNFEVSYRYSQRDSNRNAIEFDRNQLMFNALITL